jgi:S1-C subfamily serine protease
MRRKWLFAAIVAGWLAVLSPAVQLALAQDGPYLGVNCRDGNTEEAAALGWPTPRGIKLDKVVAGSGADKAGLRAGDIILAVDRVEVWGTISQTVGTTTSFLNRLQAYLDLKRPGDLVELAVFRDGREHSDGMVELLRQAGYTVTAIE